MTYHQFRDTNGQPYGSLETFHVDLSYLLANEWIKPDSDSPTGYVGGAPYSGADPDDFYACDTDPTDLVGWYWQACFPGCLPDGDPSGPFPSESEALADAGALRTYTLPSHWASALINGDTSGLDDHDCTMLEAVEIGENLGHCLGIVGDDRPDGCPDPAFHAWHDARGYGVLACHCFDFVFDWPAADEDAQ